ncbi:SURF1 family protein [Neptuniibacter sp.]|uniref:SURF1 family protein n=1 Tax=Neptuniibacter sp. TaxID=1962643 RepID=UPI0026277C7F|nr:SURF1 family protein [Neptuniibacter sp.]MCP4597463.1 SURF1 family protein [Neptuniibacter sp.]
MSKVQSNQGFKWMLMLAAVLLLPGLVALGFWQLDRADQKERLLQSWSATQLYKTIPDEMAISGQQFIAVDLEGFFDRERYFLLDNRVRNGMAGYEVIALFYPRNGSALLVNLGWIEADYDRRILPKVLLPSGTQKVVGKLKGINHAFVLDEDLAITERQWPSLIQSLDTERMGDLLQEPVLPLELKIKQPLISGLDLNWPVVSMSPEKHLGYAVQWFAMALVLSGLLLWSWKLIQRESRHE